MNYRRIITTIICSSLVVVVIMVGCVSPAQEQVIMGDSFLKQEKWEDAITAYTKAIELDSKLAVTELCNKVAKAYYNRGLAYEDKDNIDNACADYTQAISIDPKLATPELLTTLAKAFYNKG
jgi:tetratricopeptide (TPR) repeat protein